VKPRRLSSDKLRATESTQHPLLAISAISWRTSALLGAAAVLALLLAVALFSGAIRFSGRCAVPPARVHATLTGLVERGLSQIALPIAAPSVQRQHFGPGIPYAAAGTFNASVHALRVGAIECTACYPDGRTFFDHIPPKVVVRLVEVNATASVEYQGYAALGELELELDLEQPAGSSKVTSCGGAFAAVAPAVTGQKSVDTSAVSSGVAQAICYGSSSERGVGARAETSSSGLAGALSKEVRAALPELRDAVQAEVDGTLLRLLAMSVLLLAAGWACALPATRKFTVESIRRVYAWVHDLAQPYPAHRPTVRPSGDTQPTAPRERAAARPPAAVRADGPELRDPNPNPNPDPNPDPDPDPNPGPNPNRNPNPNPNPKVRAEGAIRRQLSVCSTAQVDRVRDTC